MITLYCYIRIPKSIINDAAYDTTLIQVSDPTDGKAVTHGDVTDASEKKDVFHMHRKMDAKKHVRHNTPHLLAKMFPSLFIRGHGDFYDTRPRPVSLSDWAKHMMQLDNEKFACHPRFIFILQILLARKTAYREIQLTLRTSDNISKQDIVNCLLGKEIAPGTSSMSIKEMDDFIKMNTRLTHTIPG